jgi:rfaE bifunctional protein nucleotidyltransferase chain/domain
MNTHRSKIKSILEVSVIVKKAKQAGKRIITTNGAFDLLHIGHIRNLEMAKSLGDILIVGVNSDKSVRTHKDQFRPIMPEKERAEVIAALDAVDYVFIFSTQNPIPWLKKIKPHVHAKGADRTLAEMPERIIVEKYGGTIQFIPYKKGHSTTAIIKKIKSIPN